MSSSPTFFVGNIPVYGDVVLAPMAGYSDVPYRALCRAYGSAMHYTEFVPVEALLGRRVHERFRRRLDKKADEHPIVFQIFGNDAQKFLEAALRISEWGPDIIDINMGCSTRKVSGRGAGAGMMPQPQLVADTFRLLSQHLSLPVTGKIRLGWDATSKNYLEIARIMEDNGAALIAMHARTKAQKYAGTADWPAIAALKSVVSIPVIGNGDICHPQDIDSLLAQTGCEAVMIGRAAIGNPWIFSRQDRSNQHYSAIFNAIQLHVQEMVAYYGEAQGLRQFRKHLKRYLADIGGIEGWLPELLQVTKLKYFLHILEKMAAVLTADLAVTESSIHKNRETIIHTKGN